MATFESDLFAIVSELDNPPVLNGDREEQQFVRALHTKIVTIIRAMGSFRNQLEQAAQGAQGDALAGNGLLCFHATPMLICSLAELQRKIDRIEDLQENMG